jgi:hypothetical protein
VAVGPLPRNVRDGTRMSTALTYLAPARPRPNLEIRPDTLVDRVLITGRRARGVQLHTGERVEADAVVLAAGAYGSPAILLRSGVGPAEQLRRLDLPVVADLLGVGANLVDHPLVSVDLPATPGPGGPTFQVLLTLRSPLATATGPPDLHLFPDRSTTRRSPAAPCSGLSPGCSPPAPGDPCGCARPTPPHRPASTPPTCDTPTTSPEWSRPPKKPAGSAGQRHWQT